jgi:pimeloyl-ACP methyl ester carboxylesterase
MAMTSAALRLLVVAFVAVTGVSGAATAGHAAPRVVQFAALDGVTLQGRLYGAGAFGVVLTHQLRSDASEWDSFAQTLAARGYRVLAMNVRGTCPGQGFGCSRGAFVAEEIWRDVGGASRYLRSHGVRSVALVGASMGGEASLLAAAQSGAGVVGVVSLSGSEGFAGPLDPREERRLVRRVRVPKLFVAGATDTTAAQAARNYQAIGVAPKRLVIVPSSAHGVRLLDDPAVGARVTRTAIDFLTDLRGG